MAHFPSAVMESDQSSLGIDTLGHISVGVGLSSAC